MSRWPRFVESYQPQVWGPPSPFLPAKSRCLASQNPFFSETTGGIRGENIKQLKSPLRPSFSTFSLQKLALKYYHHHPFPYFPQTHPNPQPHPPIRPSPLPTWFRLSFCASAFCVSASTSSRCRCSAAAACSGSLEDFNLASRENVHFIRWIVISWDANGFFNDSNWEWRHNRDDMELGYNIIGDGIKYYVINVVGG